jgi:hypothetical protein
MKDLSDAELSIIKKGLDVLELPPHEVEALRLLSAKIQTEIAERMGNTGHARLEAADFHGRPPGVAP